MTIDSKHWLATEHDDGNVHVVPLDDERVHVFTIGCECQPEIEPKFLEGEMVGMLVGHNAWDRRELHEPGPAW